MVFQAAFILPKFKNPRTTLEITLFAHLAATNVNLAALLIYSRALHALSFDQLISPILVNETSLDAIVFSLRFAF